MSMIKLLLITNYLYVTIHSVPWQWHSYRIVNRKLSTISPNETAWIRENCGIRNESMIKKPTTGFKIYGGQETVDYEYPWAVGIEMYIRVFKGPAKIPSGYKVYICSGSLISNQHVLTAQHCFTNAWHLPEQNETTLFDGSETVFKSKMTIGKGNPSSEYQYVTEEVARHVPTIDYYSYPLTTKKDDWAVLEIADKVPRQLMDIKAIVPVCLPANNESVDNFDLVETYGQGKIDHNIRGPLIMRYKDAKIKSTKPRQDGLFPWKNLVSIDPHFSRPGDSGGGITKAIQVSENQTKCRRVLVGITLGEDDNTTLAIHTPTITDNVQRFTKISI